MDSDKESDPSFDATFFVQYQKNYCGLISDLIC